MITCFKSFLGKLVFFELKVKSYLHYEDTTVKMFKKFTRIVVRENDTMNGR